jgi:predicted alpha-1,2-mannosidase
MSKLSGILHKMGLTLLITTVISCQPHTLKNTNLNYIDPSIGNVAPLENPNRPVVQLPNQMIRVFPLRYDHLDLQITGFPMLALNIITPQVVFLMKPSIGEISDTSWYRRLNYDQDFEVHKPWYYSTLLSDENILTEFTAGARTGIYRFTFPEGKKMNLLMSHCYKGGSFDFANTNEIYGNEYVEDVIHQQKGIAYLYGKFSGIPEFGKNKGEKNWGKYSVGKWGGVNPTRMEGEKAWISYKEKSPRVIELRYAISFISREQAKENFKELEKQTFEDLMEKGRSAWEKVVNQIKVEGGTEAQRRTFYTSLYRCYARMSDISEDGKYFSGYDKKIHEDKRPFYVDDYSWGNFLALHPLTIILDPDKEADMLQSYVRMYQESGWMPEYPKHFGDRAGMLGFHSSIMFLDAYRKGVRNFDAETALEGMLKNAEGATMLPGRNGKKSSLEDFFNEKGYYPSLSPGEKETDTSVAGKTNQKRSGTVTITLLHSYDSWALAELAKELGNQEVYRKVAPKAKNYKNVWNPEKKFFLPKDAMGRWIDIDPKFSGEAYYNENNGTTYLWHVQHDIEGLVELMGGTKEFERRLDGYFTERLETSKIEFWSRFSAMTGMIGQFGMGNQLTFFIPYLYNYTGSPWKTQKMTRLLLDSWFKDNIFGVPGDEDGGSMSAFVVFTSMGFYPMKPGVPLYTITSPLFSKITIDLPGGKTFTLIANNCSRTNKYIQAATLNGKALLTPWFSHDDLLNGGTIVLEMSEKPGKIWENNKILSYK